MGKLENFGKRLITAFFAGIFVLYAIYQGDWLFDGMILVACTVMSLEWGAMMGKAQKKRLSLYILGFFYITSPCVCLIYLRDLPYGLVVTLWLFITVWVIDITAYIFGSAIGGVKIAPNISPKKTWSGLISAMIFAYFTGLIFDSFAIYKLSYTYAMLGILITLVSQFGDFLESYFKRYFSFISAKPKMLKYKMMI